MVVRSNSELQSKLPAYLVKPSKDFPGYLIVRCPRETCPSHGRKVIIPFIVKASAWRRPLKSTINPDVTLRGRSCPYCFAASRLPD